MRAKIFKQKAIMWLAINVGWLLMRLMYAIARPHVVNPEVFKEVTESRKPVILPIWHGRMLFPIIHHRDMGIVPLISMSRDGEMISKTIERLGYGSIRGSSSKRSKEALQEMEAILKKDGSIVAITPDGPRGPRHSVKPGVIHLARETGAVILSMSFSAQKPKVLRSWDKFLLWRPFSRLILIYGEPISFDKSGDFDEQKELLRSSMIELEQKADSWF
jgi:lysophospholipid acyltransferase (LPLAT)-like uncharacterized protein